MLNSGERRDDGFKDELELFIKLINEKNAKISISDDVVVFNDISNIANANRCVISMSKRGYTQSKRVNIKGSGYTMEFRHR